MKIKSNTVLIICLFELIASNVVGQSKRLKLHHADNFEVARSDFQDTTFVTGSVVFEDDDGIYYCDSAIWVRAVSLVLKGNVKIEGNEERIVADVVEYDLKSGDALALGSHVELWSYEDSLFAVGTHAFLNGGDNSFTMEHRPTIYLNYPDTAKIIEVIADNVDYYSSEDRAEASGNVKISSDELSTSSGCAIMWTKENLLYLNEDPIALQGQSRISGQVIQILTENGQIRQIDVIDSAQAELVEIVDSVSQWSDRSTISGDRIIMDFIDGQLTTITCVGQSYSSYYPSTRGLEAETENKVSGDTILLHIDNRRLRVVEVFGGAVGTYLSSKTVTLDSLTLIATDTVDYQASYLKYDIDDSLITMNVAGKVSSGQMELEAYRIEYDTRAQVVKAFSAEVTTDSNSIDSSSTAALQPNQIPVALHDKEDVIYGDYLEYSLETEKGRIQKSKSSYETGFFYGRDVHRQQKHILYLSDGKYTTCDADEPHYHFSSKNLKLIENDRLIARPVVFNIGRIPIFVLPYYVFPLKKGRHSGILPFSFGNIERGERYIRNVGYYVAVSEYWDWQASMDFFELNSRLNLYSKLTYNKRYAFGGFVKGNFGRSTEFNTDIADEFRRNRWSFEANHNHQLTPSFKINAFGKIQSDATFFNDFSTNLQDRLDRDLRSRLNFTKTFSRTISLSGEVNHVENIDRESRTDNLPNLNLSLPPIRPFGEGSRDETGILKQKWYNNIIFRYSPSLQNFSSRVTNDSLVNIQTETTIITDTLGNADTTILITSADTLRIRSRKKYTRLNHSPRLTLPTMRIAKYFRLQPSFSYSETWYKIHETDQSLSDSIDATSFRAYSYSLAASLKTDLYGTVYPNLLGLVGIRQVLSPTVSYSFVPKIDKNPDVRAFAGGGPGSIAKSQRLNFELRQVYQAKIQQGLVGKTLELISITSNASYDIESKTRPWENLSTTFRSYLIPKINIDGSMIHSLYKPDSDELNFFSPVLESFRVNSGITLAGQKSLFDEDEVIAISDGVDSASYVGTGSSGRRGWSLRMNYSYSESGRGSSFNKSSFIRFALSFNLTKNTSIEYNQYYDFKRSKTINSQVNITRKLHAWTGNFFWVPVGSNRGYGFRLFVTAIPAIKFDNSQGVISSSRFQDLR